MIVNHMEAGSTKKRLSLLCVQAFDDPLIIKQHPQLFNDGCLSPNPYIPPLFTSSLHKYIIIGCPDLIDKPSWASS